MNVVDEKKRFWRNFRILAGANSIALAIMVCLAPVLGWIFSPEDFGQLAYFMFGFQLLISVCVCRIDWLIPNAKTETEELCLIAWGGVALVCTCGVSLVLINWPPNFLNSWKGISAVGPLLTLVPIAAFAMGIRLLITARLVRISNLRSVSQVRIHETLVNAGLSVIFGLSGLLTGGLIWARVAASAVSAGYLTKQKPLTNDRWGSVTKAKMINTFRSHWRPASIASFVSLVNTTSTNAAIFVLGALAGTLELGFYLMATRLIATPIQLGSKALAQSFWARSAELARRKSYNEMRNEYLSLLVRLLAIALIVAFILVVIGLQLEKLFPAEWKGLGNVFIAYIPAILGIITVSSTNHLRVFNKVHLQLIADTIRLAGTFIFTYYLYSIGADFYKLVLATSFSSLAGHYALFAIHLHVYKKLRKLKN